MNDTGFYTSAAFQQHPELCTPIHTVEHDNFGNLTHNNSYFDDEPTFLITASDAANSPQMVVLPQPPSLLSLPLPLPVASGQKDNNNGYNIPFVQIHTTDLQQPPQKTHREVFRRKTAEIIKSEPIKSEHAEAAKDRVNPTPTPPTRDGSTMESAISTQLINENNNNNNNNNIETEELPAIHMCPSCPFLSLCQHKAEVHKANCFGDPERRRIQCPGCENLFYSENSLKSHLGEDHLLEPHEISTLIFAFNHQRFNKQTSTTTTKDAQPKSRIFIKNVNCLREPQPECVPQEMTDYIQLLPQEGNGSCNSSSSSSNSNNILDIFDNMPANETQEDNNNSSSCIEPIRPPRQKISIKSVDVLREPALLPFDFQLPQLDMPPVPVMSGNNPEATKPQPPRAPKIYIRNVDILKDTMLVPAPSLPSIIYNGSTALPTIAESFEGNVDLPSFEPPLPSMSNICAEVFGYDTAGLSGGNNCNLDNYVTLNVSNSNNSSSSNSSSSSSSCSNNSSCGASSYPMENTRFSALDLDFGVFEQTVPPLVTEPTPPPLPLPPLPQTSLQVSSNTVPIGIDAMVELPLEQQSHHPPPPPLPPSTTTEMVVQQEPPHILQCETMGPKQKIFIKNVDILKAPQFQQQRHEHQQQRGTLHLRTVDELNLMNRVEVEHLIAPHMEHILELPVQQFTGVRTQLSDSWPSSDSYDLADDLDCIVMAPLEQLANPADTPELDTLSQMADNMLIDDFAQLYVPQSQLQPLAEAPPLPPPPPPPLLPPQSPMKHEWAIGSNAIHENLLPGDIEVISPTTTPITEVPPLAPVTVKPTEVASPPTNMTSLPMPPLVRCAATKELPAAAAAPPPPPPTTTATTTTSEKPARIYVANNLLPTAPTDPLPTALAGGTSVRGRPYGAKRATNAKPRKATGGNDQQSQGGKCTVNGCVFRFKSPTTLEYHRRCHNGSINAAQPMICPQCHSTEFSNWNCLHTHLWRTHQIDMELYCCHLCTFKTPIYSRLVNTHSKIHSEERNYKCEQCGKAFKNTKQLKNHRRLHRTQGLGLGKATTTTSSTTTQVTPATVPELAASLHRCGECGAAYTQLKTLREHLCKQRNETQAQCDICQRVVSSKSSLKLHMLTHRTEKRFKCEHCDYEANDHNAFRRHRATHRNQIVDEKLYACPHCDYKAIQSTAYQIHVQQKHPEQASSLLHKCNTCAFSTINAGLLLIHQAKHEVVATSGSGTRSSTSPSRAKIKMEINSQQRNEHSSSSTNVVKAIETASLLLPATAVAAAAEQIETA